MPKEHLMMEQDAEASLFKKKVKHLQEYKGRGTELISQYIPFGADRSSVMNQLNQEAGQATNIKSQNTRKNVTGALRKISTFLKSTNFEIPKNGIVVFCGNVSGQEGVSDIRLFTVHPILPLKTKMYWCDSTFHLDPLLEMMKPNEVFAIITIDKRECTMALLIGKKYEIVGHYTSLVPGKTKAGGQSAHRFEQLREEAERDFFKTVAEKMAAIYLQYEDKIKGVILAGPGVTKNEFLEVSKLDYRIEKLILGKIDTSYTDESGIREALQKTDDILRETSLAKERALFNLFLEQIGKDGLVVYGENETFHDLRLGMVKTFLVSEGLGWEVLKFACEECEKEFEVIVKDPVTYHQGKEVCPYCQAQKAELLEEVDYIDYVIEQAHPYGTEVRVVSIETPEGEQFLKSFGGIGGLLRFK